MGKAVIGATEIPAFSALFLGKQTGPGSLIRMQRRGFALRRAAGFGLNSCWRYVGAAKVGVEARNVRGLDSRDYGNSDIRRLAIKNEER